MNLKNTFNDKNDFTGIYRGYVVWNDDPKVKGRIKVFVPGVYSDKYESLPDCLPWARPFSPSFGGGSNNPNNEDNHVLNNEVGWCSVPHAGNITTGAQVFVFFENGDINYPIYFGVAQSGEGWFSEHPNQHCFRSDNIKVRIDENVYDKRSTSKFDSYNTYNSNVAKANLKRKCKKEGWKFDENNGNIEQLETRLDIEIEASKINAVNLNIHGNVNMHIDGDWFVEHIGDYYEYREGDRYLKHKGNTYIEENGIYRKVLNGPESYEHNGNYTENQVGDSLITRHGKYHDQIDNNVTHIYNENYKLKVNKSAYEIVGYDKDIKVGHNLNLDVINNGTVNVGGFFDFSIDSYLDFNVKDNVSIHSREGNILLKTDGQFELMDGPIITAQGFKNLGTKGNIQFISTFGNINLECIKNDALANFNQRSSIVPWNPGFLFKIRELYSNDEFNLNQAMLSGMALTTDINSNSDFIKLLDEIEQLKIYDGLPVFMPTKMIIQNPNIKAPNNEDDLSWIPTFRSEPSDWKNINEDVMWKLPGKLMGNINIETWSGDINIKTDSTIGCAGNINISASERGGTMPGYKIGTVNIKAYGNERIYPDPRDLFLDSNYEAKEAKKYQLFSHGTDFNSGSVLDKSVEELIKSTFGRTFNFVCTNYNKFYDMYGLNVVTYGHPENTDEITNDALANLKNNKAPKLGCPKCITDYLMGIPGIQEIYYKNDDIINLKGGKHDYGFQRLNPKDTKNTRGVFNITAGDFDKISIGDGHAIDIGFIDKSFAGKNIGGFTLNSNGDFNKIIGKNSYVRINNNSDRANGKYINDYVYTDINYDYFAPECLNKFVEQIGNDFKDSSKGNGYNYVTPGKNITLAAKCVGYHKESPDSRSIEAGFVNLEVMPKIEWKDGGYYIEHTNKVGSKFNKTEIYDNRYMIDYGFNFEKAHELINTNDPSNLTVNFYENELYSIDENRWIDKQLTVGGNSRWFQIDKFDKNEHIELSADLSQYSYTFEDMSANHKKHFKYYDKATVWWDNEKFDSDLVKWFPDSEFEIKSEQYEQIYKTSDLDAVSDYKEHRAWSKYGNHIKNKKHPDYSSPTDKCGAVYTVAKKKKEVTKDYDDVAYEDVDSATDLWGAKRGAGVREIHQQVRTATAQPRKFSLNTPDCGKNNNIEDTIRWTAQTDIIQDLYVLAEANNFKNQIYNGDINTHTITYKAAVNQNIIELNSTNAALFKRDQTAASSYLDQKWDLCAGNLFRILMKGNQDYYNYNPDSSKADAEIYHTDHFNNFEVSQNGFPINKMKFLNGTDSAWNNNRLPLDIAKWPTGRNPANGKYTDNEFIITNGGIGDVNPPTQNFNENSVGIYPFVSGINNIKFSNGTNFQGLADNNIAFDNGIGVLEGINLTRLRNGSILNNGVNAFRIDNEGLIGADDVENSITLNNDHQYQNINMANKWLTGIVSSEVESGILTSIVTYLRKSALSLYSNDDLSCQGGKKFYVNFPNVEYEAIYGDINFKNYSLKTNNYSNDSDEITINTNFTTLNSDNVIVAGNHITANAKSVNIQKLVGVGTLQGHVEGSFNGCAMSNGYQYSIDWPIVGSIPTQVMRHAGSIVSTSGIQYTAPTIKFPSYSRPVNNKNNESTLESQSFNIFRVFKKIFKSFIDMELSLLNTKSMKR